MRRIVLAIVFIHVSVAVADSKTKPVTISSKAITLRQPIYFETAKPVIKSESFPLLDALAAALEKEKAITLVEIQGHTDARGNDAWNLEVSEKRAQAVYTYLIGKGIDATRLRAKGYGETKPIDKHANAKAWAKNRRIDFVILQRTHD